MNGLLFFILLAASPFQIDEIEVTAKHAQVQSEAFRLVTQMSHEEVANLPVTTISDLFAYLPGVDVRTRGESVLQSDVSMRGGTFDQVLVMLNGIPLQDAQTGHYTMNIPVSPSLIERIEVLQGTAANLTGAFSGAINIITKEAQQDEYRLQMSAGTNNDVHPFFTGSWARKEVHINTSAEFARSDGYYAPRTNDKEKISLANTDYQMANIYFQTRWRGLDVQAGAQYKDAGLGTGYGFASLDQFDATRTLLVSARYNTAVGSHWSLTAMAAYRANHDRYEWHRGNATNRHWTHNAYAALHAHYASPIGRTTIGAEAKEEYINSSSMGIHQRLQATLSAEQQFIWRGLAASFGIAGHYNSWFGWYASGAANIGYSFLRTGSVYLGASRSLRMPTWTDMFYKAGMQRGNPNLKAEKAWMISLGGKYTWHWDKAGSLFVSADTYYRWGRDIIDWTYNETDSLFYSTNQQQVNAFGIDIVASYKLNRWLRGVTMRYAYTNLSLDLKEAKSQYLDYLRHKVVLTIDHAFYVWDKGCVGACWSLRYQDREGTYVDIDGKPGNSYSPVLLFDGSIYAEFPHMRVAIEGTNLTNRHYYDYSAVLQPGAHGRLCVTAHF